MFERLARRLRAYAEKDGRGYPDWALRYGGIVSRLERQGLARRRILEIGANENGFARFAGARTVAVDIALDHLRAARRAQPVRPVVADAAALPFPDRCFDIVVCVDTFEHLPEEARPRVAGEILRVAQERGSAVVTFPAGGAAARAEAAIREYYRHYTNGGTLRWLEEHAAMGLPDPATVEAEFRAATSGSREIIRDSNAPVWLWVWMWRVLMCGWPGRGNVVFQVALRWLTPVLCRVRFGPGYRTVIWIEPKRRTEDSE